MKTINNKSGFTLMEVMMSLGILVVGLAMVATAFPTAMLETKHSVADTTATMISENAAAICRVKISHSADKGLGVILSNQTSLIDAAHTGDLTYPTGTPDSRYGWLLAACQPSGNDTNDYQLVIVPYRKFLPTDATLAFSNVTVTTGSVPAGTDIGSPVILKSTGAFAFVVDSDGTLSNTLADGPALAVNYSGGNDSPAIGCYVVRTAMAP